ncbi:sensor domain-containing diguanylate cyclase [Niallia sp. MER TA 168]|uniref:sensor domain-containing diguanylate cyclase n=1 Tax=Niallia sp. MER TA 168 TaxID=2939568 RepID=UPI00203FC900|nr:sensor domain-containing diguanylate cyclase [Niallia sp. MER TA 168]MCM3362268.1 sensor domain-containing diguanylate cyclase [Niallia sp. MER TA 168]
MSFFIKKINVLLFILVALAIMELFIGFEASKETWEMIVTIAVQILQFLLFIMLMALLRKVIRQSVDKEKQYQRLLDHSPEAIYVHRKGIIVYSNEAGAKLFGFKEPFELINLHWKEILNDKSYESLRSSSEKYEMDQQFKIHHFNLYDEDGTVRYIEAKSTYILFDGEPAREVIARDVTDQEKNSQRLKDLSYLDTLTQLPNRRSLLERLNQVIEESKQKNKSFGIMFVDLDGFKQINDTYGHAKGDFLLKQVSEYLKLCIKEDDVVGRFGGDEFIIILPNAVQTDCLSLAKKIIDNMPLFISESNQVTFSIGISLYPQDGNDLDTIMKLADNAMYNAKKRGKNNFQFFDIGT